MTQLVNSMKMSEFVEFDDLINARKSNAKVLLLGSYEDLKLKDLKAFLITKGFNETRLVEDWINESEVPPESLDEHFKEKSFYYIDNWAEILVFVFFETDHISVTREWSHMIESQSEKCKCSIILRHESLDLRCLVRGDIGAERIREYHFKDENELHKSAFSGCFTVLYSFESSKQNKE
jgi:hypothetical protein